MEPRPVFNSEVDAGRAGHSRSDELCAAKPRPRKPATVVFRRQGEGFRLVGFNAEAQSLLGADPAGDAEGITRALMAARPELVDDLVRALGQTVAPEVEVELARSRSGPSTRALFGFSRASSELVLLHLREVNGEASVESQLRLAQKMEAVGRLAGGVAHDFNNLLTVINTYAELAMAALRPGDPVRDDVNEIYKAGARAAELTRQLLAFSRKQVLQPAVVDLNAIVSNVERMLRRVIGEDVELVWMPAPDLGLVKVDPALIEQVLMNLAVNARDAMPHGGTLTIRTANEESEDPGSPQGRRRYAVIAVTDTGCGMDAEVQSHLFEPFFTTKPPGKGTGLGLATAYSIVTQSGGHFRVRSKPGQGTTFFIYLPRVKDPATPPPVATNEPLEKGTETVLVVEDDGAVRALAERVLAASGYTVLGAATPVEALEICSAHTGPIHLLLTDVILPYMSGAELATRVSSRWPEVKVLYMSGYNESAIFGRGMVGESARFLAKPFSSADLARKVREVLGPVRSHR